MNMGKNSSSDLERRYRDICKEYLVAFCNNYGIAAGDGTDGMWVGGQVGTIACIGDYYFDFTGVIKYSVDNDLRDWGELVKWYDYTLFCHEYNQNVPNFHSWHKGCPRLSETEQQRLRDLKSDFEAAIKDYKERY